MGLTKTLWTIIQDLSSTGQNVSDNLDTAFENIDDAIDQIDTNTADVVDLKAPEKIAFEDMTGNEPAYAAGQIFYAEGTVRVHDDYPAISHSIGRAIHMEVLNNTGSPIFSGRACRHNGVTAGQVKVVLALADSFVNATILGISAHEIPDGEVGLLTTFGSIHNVDTSDVPIGVPLFLSDTDAGGFTATSPIIRTQVGGALVSNETTGELFATIVNNAPLPRTLGSLLEATAPTSLPADLVNATPVSDYSDSIEIVTEANEVTGILTVSLAGIYRVNFSLHMTFDNVGQSGNKEFYVDLRDVTSDTLIKSLKGFILDSSEAYSLTDNGAVTLEANHEYRLELRSEGALTNFAFSSSTFYLESVLY